MPSCLNESAKTIHLKHFDISQDQVDLVSSVAETIIPKTDTPGATDLGLQHFVLKMVDDCTPKDTQQDFLKGADQLESRSKKLYGKSFALCSKQQREAMLNNIEQHPESVSKEEKTFFKTAKGFTVFGYTYSKFFMTKELVYELVPGRYNGYFPVNKAKGGPKFG